MASASSAGAEAEVDGVCALESVCRVRDDAEGEVLGMFVLEIRNRSGERNRSALHSQRGRAK